MSFFKTRSRSPSERKNQGKPAAATLHTLECKICPLNNSKNITPKMAPVGSEFASIYMLGSAPSEIDDDNGEPFSDKSGKLIRHCIPKANTKSVRWSNIIRTRPPGGRDPAWEEIECCRPFSIRDIEHAAPLAIFGYGQVPLSWALPDGVDGHRSRISTWRGRRFPIQVGKHSCWYYPLFDTNYVFDRSKNQKLDQVIATHDGLTFKKDIENALSELDWINPAVVEQKSDYHKGVVVAYDIDTILRELDFLKHETHLAIDIETNGLRPYAQGSKILSIAIGTCDRVVAFPIRHREAKWSKNDLDLLDTLVPDYLLSYEGKIVAHNAAFEMEWLSYFYGRKLLRDCNWGDSQSQAYVIDERRDGLSLDFLCMQYFGFALKPVSNLDRKRLDEEPLDDVLKYNALDSKYTHKLYLEQESVIAHQPSLLAFYDKEQMRRLPAMVMTQQRGIVVNTENAVAYQSKMDDQISAALKSIYKDPIVKTYESKYGQFSPTSPDNVTILLRDVLKRDEGRKRNGSYSSDEETLSKIGLPICEMILQVRKFAKIKGTYLDSLVPGGRLLYPDGLLHTILNTMFTETGRLSSEDPNIQNFPKRKDKWVRGVIFPRRGHILLSVDYGQIEPRVIAAWSQDPVLINMLWDDYDIHGHWAERIAHSYPAVIGGKKFLTDKKALKILRQDTKSNFVLAGIYGSEPRAIANRMKIPEDVCVMLLDEFWDVFQHIKQWQATLIENYWMNGYVECLTGRRRHAPLPGHRIINTPVQGTASDITVDAMCRLSEQADEYDLEWLQAIMNIHDDLTFDIPDNKIDDALEHITEEMLAVPYDFMNSVPISIEVEAGYSWAEMETIDKYTSKRK